MSTTKVQGDMIDVDAATVAVVAAGDKFNFLDITDSLVKEDTIQGVLDLVSAGFTLGTEQATTSGSSVTFGSIPAATTVIDILFEGVTISTTNKNLECLIGDAGGLETSGYVGLSHSWNLSGSAAHLAISDTFSIGGSVNAANNTSLWSGVMRLRLKNASAFTWVFDGMAANDQTSQDAIYAGSFVKSLSAELTQLSFATNGVFSAGSVNILYM